MTSVWKKPYFNSKNTYKQAETSIHSNKFIDFLDDYLLLFSVFFSRRYKAPASKVYTVQSFTPQKPLNHVANSELPSNMDKDKCP